MRKVIAILFSVLLLLQALPVAHLFQAKATVICSVADDDKNDDGKQKEKKDGKEYLSLITAEAAPLITVVRYTHSFTDLHNSPSLDSFTPPPDAAC